MEADGEEEEEEQVDPRSLKPDLFAAAQQNDTGRVLELLAMQVPATYVDDSNGWTPLHWAAKNGNVTMLNKMIESGASAPYHRMVLRAKQAALEQASKNGAGGGANSSAAAAAAATAATAASAAAAGAAAAAAADNAENGAGPNDASAGETAEAPPGSEELDPEAAAAAAASAAAATAGATATGTTTAPHDAAEMYDEDEDEDDEYGMERRLETSVDLTKNTPLLWACVKGHLGIVWSLLVDGYSPNDLDDMGNNALHLAAAAGNRKIVKILIDDGVMSTLVNMYKNLPIDMATDKEVREMISDAMLKGASMTAADMEIKHEANMRTFNKLVNALNTAVAQAKEVLDGLDKPVSASPRQSVSAKLGDAIRMLGDALRIGKEWSLDQDVLAAGEGYLSLLETSQELVNDITAAEKEFPFRSQGQYTQHVRKVELAVEKAEQQGVTMRLTSLARDIVQRAQIETWISTMLARLAPVECAMEHHEHDMNKLKAALIKGQVQQASGDIVAEAIKLHRRLECELGMTRALLSFPTYKLPWTKADEPPPEGYYTEADFGHVKETEEYPHPPADTGEYIWEPSVTFSSLQSCIAKLKEAFTGADQLGADPKTLTEAKARLLKSEKDFKLINVKEENDKLAGIEETKKKIKKKPAPKPKK